MLSTNGSDSSGSGAESSGSSGSNNNSTSGSGSGISGSSGSNNNSTSDSGSGISESSGSDNSSSVSVTGELSGIGGTDGSSISNSGEISSSGADASTNSLGIVHSGISSSSFLPILNRFFLSCSAEDSSISVSTISSKISIFSFSGSFGTSGKTMSSCSGSICITVVPSSSSGACKTVVSSSSGGACNTAVPFPSGNTSVTLSCGGSSVSSDKSCEAPVSFAAFGCGLISGINVFVIP